MRLTNKFKQTLSNSGVFSDKRLLNYQQRLTRLRVFTLLFFVLLLVPAIAIFYMGVKQLEQKQLIKYQKHSVDVTQSINKRLFKRRVFSDAITPEEFEYYQHIYNPATKELTQSLSLLASTKYFKRDIGVVGFFQYDQQGRFSSPVWPYIFNSQDDIKVSQNEMGPDLIARRALAQKVFDITSSSGALQNILANNFPEDTVRFDLLSEHSDYFIFYRVAKLNEELKLQGYVVEREAYIHSRIKRVMELYPFEQPILLSLHNPNIQFPSRYFHSFKNSAGEIEVTQSAQEVAELTQVYIGEHPLQWPFTHYKIVYSTAELKQEVLAAYSAGAMFFISLIIGLGCYGFYRIGVRQITLAEERLNFVSSVSHELKTPLTSIRMYSEMLKTGQVLSDEHQKDYYDFIFTESERLSRLIDNILQLAKLSQPQHSVDPRFTKLSVLIDIIHSKVSSLVDKNGFKLNVTHNFEYAENIELLVDIDAFAQVVINITDNAVKFFDKTAIKDVNRQQIDVNFAKGSTNSEQVILTIRDYGVGITTEQEDKLFELFYRGGNEMTRTTQGTGIGLALVNELMIAQQGSIQAQRMEPGLLMKMAFQSRSI